MKKNPKKEELIYKRVESPKTLVASSSHKEKLVIVVEEEEEEEEEEERKRKNGVGFRDLGKEGGEGRKAKYAW